jgi:hypothetical protein
MIAKAAKRRGGVGFQTATDDCIYLNPFPQEKRRRGLA